jgi:hypothetical protein
MMGKPNIGSGRGMRMAVVALAKEGLRAQNLQTRVLPDNCQTVYHYSSIPTFHYSILTQ